MNIFDKLALTPLINVSGTETQYGAAPAHPKVIEAISEILPFSVSMLQAQGAASRTIARAIGTEGGCITGCTAAAIAIAVAATMTGRDLGKVERLPDSRGMKNEVILQRGHEVTYGQLVSQNVRLAGAKVIEIGAATQCGVYQLRAAITEQTAAALYVVSHLTAQNRLITLEAFCDVCHEHGTPVIVNAASQSDPRVYVRAGADLVLFSAHKFFAGLTAGIIGGKMELVQACMYQGQGIGRPMKVGKEGVIGAIAALEQWMALDLVHERNVLEARLKRFQDRLTGLTGVAASRKGNQIELRISPTDARITAYGLAAALRSEHPAIIVWDHLAEANILLVTLNKVSDETANFVADRIRDVCARAECVPVRLLVPNITDRMLAELETWPVTTRLNDRNGSLR